MHPQGILLCIRSRLVTLARIFTAQITKSILDTWALGVQTDKSTTHLPIASRLSSGFGTREDDLLIYSDERHATNDRLLSSLAQLYIVLQLFTTSL